MGTETRSPPPDRTTALALRGATVRRGGRAIVEGVDLAIGAGERVALIGPSGAGKTTLLRLWGASLWPDGGQVRTLSEDPAALGGRRLRRLRRRIGFLRQHDNLVAPLRVAHNVLMGRLGSWSTLRAAWNLVWPGELDVARRALEQVELGERLWALPDELSGGERQRVAIARLIVQRPDVILADEPTSALDVRLGGEVVDRLVALAAERGAALVASLHGLDVLDRGFDRVVALREGRVHWQGSPASLDREVLHGIYGAELRQLAPEAASRPIAP